MFVPSPSQTNLSIHPKTVVMVLPLVPTMSTSPSAVVCVCGGGGGGGDEIIHNYYATIIDTAIHIAKCTCAV